MQMNVGQYYCSDVSKDKDTRAQLWCTCTIIVLLLSLILVLHYNKVYTGMPAT